MIIICNACIQSFDETELVDGKIPDHLSWTGQCGDPECCQSYTCSAVGEVPKDVFDEATKMYKPYSL